MLLKNIITGYMLFRVQYRLQLHIYYMYNYTLLWHCIILWTYGTSCNKHLPVIIASSHWRRHLFDPYSRLKTGWLHIHRYRCLIYNLTYHIYSISICVCNVFLCEAPFESINIHHGRREEHIQKLYNQLQHEIWHSDHWFDTLHAI